MNLVFRRKKLKIWYNQCRCVQLENYKNLHNVFEIRCLTFVKSQFWMLHTLLRRPDGCIRSVQNRKAILVIILWFSPLLAYFFVLFGRNIYFKIVASVCANVLLWILDALLSKTGWMSTQNALQWISFNNFHKDF